MESTSKTLYIPLYGKASVSAEGVLLRDPKAEEIWGKEGFALGGKSRSRWLSYYMGMRAAVIDDWLRERLRERPDSLALHLGCGLDSRAERVSEPRAGWFDVDLPEVIETRKRYYSQAEGYNMLGADVVNPSWLSQLPRAASAAVVMEGLSMYLSLDGIKALFEALQNFFDETTLIMDVYTSAAVSASKYSNPIRDVGASALLGIDDPRALEINSGVKYIKSLSMTPQAKIDELAPLKRRFFKMMFAGAFADKLYRLYTYKIMRP